MASATFDSNAGQQLGIEIWRIEKMEPKRQPKEEQGQFYSGDAYLILHTYEQYSSRAWDLFFWLGKDCSQDERGAAAYMTVALDDHLGGAPVQYREVQGHESNKFMALFPNIRYLEGGIESGFRKVEKDVYDPRLFHLKGKRNVRVQQVELSTKSMNDGDVFLLDAGLTLYQWNGSNANKYEKFKGLELSNQINANERGGRCEIHIIEDGKDAGPEEFWKLLGGKGKIMTADEAGGDDDHKEAEKILFKISDASGSLEVTEVGRGKLKKELLDPNDCFILDSGSTVFVWVGKGATKQERSQSVIHATKYLADNNRPDWTPIQRVPGGGEPPVFQQCFVDWNMMKKMDFGASESKKAEDVPVDIGAMRKRQREAEEKMADDGSGKIQIWRVEDFKRVEWPESMYGQFYAGDSFVLLYTYEKAGKPCWIIYFWQGRDSSTDEKGASALIAKEMDDELGGDPVQVRVVQNKEPAHFLTLFKGKMVVHEGGKASGFKNSTEVDSYDTDGVSLFHVKGTTALNTRAIQVAEKAESLNSGDCFILLTEPTIYVWEGKGANDDEKTTAKAIAETLKFKRNLVEVTEGSEPDEFWAAIGGKGEYPQFKEVEVEVEPRLFQGTTSKKGYFTVEEIFDFTQDDLIQDDVMILDAYHEVYVWIGNGANKKEKDGAMQAALDYVKACDDGRDVNSVPVYRVNAGDEPPSFTMHFLGWNDAKASDFSDPYAAAKAKVKKPLEKVTADSIGFAKGTFPYEDLKANKVPDIDPSNKQDYLSDADFQTVFKMSKDEFNKLAKWKQANAKKAAGLF